MAGMIRLRSAASPFQWLKQSTVQVRSCVGAAEVAKGFYCKLLYKPFKSQTITTTTVTWTKPPQRQIKY